MGVSPAHSKPQRIANRYLEQGLGHIANWEELDAICRQYGEVRRQMFVECMPEPEPASAPMEIEVDVPGLFPSTTFAASVQKARRLPRPLVAPPWRVSRRRCGTEPRAVGVV
jgi:hypothetical protein